MRLPLRLFGFLAVALTLSCLRAARPGAVSPADVAALEAQQARHPADPLQNLRLAQAYYAAGRFADARRTAARTLELQPANDEARVYLGLSYEGLAQFDSARATYTRLLAARPSEAVRRLLAGRLAMMTRAELVWAARQAIARESLLAQTPPSPNTIAVMPFQYVGSDSAIRPLERGLAALVVTDLSRVGQLRVVERARLQALLDELGLAHSDRLDPATGARSGRLVRAAEVVQGQFSSGPDSRLRIDASVVRAADAEVAATGSNADKLQALFDIEKGVVFQLLDRLGITLTPGERTAISERPTHDVTAFLLYSRGLEAADRGDFAAAAASFSAAAARDPGFAAPSQQAAASQAAQTAAATPPAEIAAAAGAASVTPETPGLGGGGALASAINGAVPTGAAMLDAVTSSSGLALPESDPNRICEGATCDGPTRAVLIGGIIIIFKLP